jgi:hypothetical protein
MAESNECIAQEDNEIVEDANDDTEETFRCICDGCLCDVREYIVRKLRGITVNG